MLKSKSKPLLLFAFCCAGFSLVCNSWMVYHFGTSVPKKDEVNYIVSANELGTLLLKGGLHRESAPGHGFTYPLFLAPFVFFQGGLPTAALYAQSFLLAISVILAFRCSALISNNIAAAITAFLAASYVPAMEYSSDYVTESVSTFLLIAYLLTSTKLLIQRQDPLPDTRLNAFWATAAAIIGFLLIHGRAVALLCVPITILALIASVLKGSEPRPSRTVRNIKIALGTLIVTTALFHTSMLARNYFAYGQAIIVRGKSRLGDFPYHSAEFISKGLSLTEARSKAKELSTADALGRSETPLSVPLSRKASHVFQRLRIMSSAHPVLREPIPFTGYKLYLRPPMRFWTAIRAHNRIWHLTMFSGVSLCMGWAIKRRKIIGIHCLLVPMSMIALYSLTHAIPRYHVVPYMGLTVAAGIGHAWWATPVFSWFSEKFRGRKSDAKRKHPVPNNFIS